MTGERLAEVRHRIEVAARRVGRDPGDVQLVAVSKDQPVESMIAAYEAGQRLFGENRAQSLDGKRGALPGDVEWHFIGPLQRNKVSVVHPHVVLLHSLDRDRLATRWGEGPPALVQVRLGGETTKHGYEPEEVAGAVQFAFDAGVSVVGLMTIPPPARLPEDARRWFSQLREIRDRVTEDHPQVRHLSMGMSDDFEVAVEEGATIVRVGSAIFGPRTTQ